MKIRLLSFTLIGILVVTASAWGQFSSNDLAILIAAASANNTTVSVVEINKTSSGQSAIQTINTDPSTIRVSGSAASTLYAANSNDGTLFCFTGANTSNTSSNVNTITTRAVVTINNAGTVTLATTYTGTSGNQTRCATTVDNTNWYIGDQGGFYTNNSTGASPTGNIRSVKSFGGIVYGFTASASLPPVGTISTASGGTYTALPGLANGASSRQDFYLISSGSNGSTFDVLYVLDATSVTAGTIFKYSLVSGSWTANGSYTTSFGGFGLSSEKSGTGATLYVTTGTGASVANSVIKLTDDAGYNATINITTGNNVTLFTAATGTIIKGIAFAPALTPTPVVLTSFTAVTQKVSAQLKWNTATEVNNFGFEIERRTINSQQSAIGSWQKIGFVAGAGTSNSSHDYLYSDNTVAAGSFAYRLKQIDMNGSFKYSQETQVTIEAPKVFSLNQNYPNPFNPSTTIEFTIPSDGKVTLKVFDLLGRQVATLFDGMTNSGEIQRVVFDASMFPSGVYFARLDFGGKQLLKRMVFMK